MGLIITKGQKLLMNATYFTDMNKINLHINVQFTYNFILPTMYSTCTVQRYHPVKLSSYQRGKNTYIYNIQSYYFYVLYLLS